MKKRFRPTIKHDVVTGTYTIRDKHGVVIQIPDVLVDRLDNHYSEVETQKIALLRSYRQLVEENKRIEKENKALRLQADTYFDEWQEAKKRIEELENRKMQE